MRDHPCEAPAFSGRSIVESHASAKSRSRPPAIVLIVLAALAMGLYIAVVTHVIVATR
jgi:hypothetical protein